MKLKLIALAVAAVASAAATAQTANVTLYGVVDTYVANVRTSSGKTAAGVDVAGNTVNVVDAGGLSGSRFGFRGSESLGGGLNAIFTLEAGIRSDVGLSAQGGRLFGRQAFVGLNGGFGTVSLGRQYAPAFYVICETSADGCSNFDVSGNHWSNLPSMLRIDNSVNFKTANYGGFSAAFMWGAGESPVGTSANRTFGANAQYANGPIYVGLGFSDAKGPTGASIGRTTVLGGSFDAGVAKISAGYLTSKYTFGATTFKGWQLGANVPLGAASLTALYGQGKVGSAKQAIFDIGANYAFSKRTDAYVRIANQDNNASFNFDGGGFGGPLSTAFGADKRVIALGMRHRF